MSFESPPLSPPDPIQSIADMTVSLKHSVWASENAEDAHIAITALNAAKRKLKKQRRHASFLANALSAPRDDKAKQARIQPIRCGDTMSFSPAEWEKEFTAYYKNLFDDPGNTTDVQNLRIARLETSASSEEHIAVPLFLVREVLSSAGRRGSKADGLDRISWGALACLPFSGIETLRGLVEARLNGSPGHNAIVQGWSSILVHLIPKKPCANTVKLWRPIAICSVLQKFYLAVIVKLASYYARPTLEEQAGFASGRQTMEISETCRLVLNKCATWGKSVFLCKLDIHRAFDALTHDVIEHSLLSAGCPARIRLAFIREGSHCHMQLHFQGHTFAPQQNQRGKARWLRHTLLVAPCT
jgi:hypothetical protein